MDALPFSFHWIARQVSGCQQRTGTRQSRLEPNCEIKKTMEKGNPALNISAICLLSSLLVAVAASATGVTSVFDLGFTRSATETLKKLDINDAFNIAVSSPAVFTFCRKGSSTLWKYQALDLEQQAAIQVGQKRSLTDYQRITVAQVDSVACKQDHLAPLVRPAIRRELVLGLITLFLLVGLLYTYRAIMHGRYDQGGFSKPGLQRLRDSRFAYNSTVMALAAWGIAVATAFVYFGF